MNYRATLYECNPTGSLSQHLRTSCHQQHQRGGHVKLMWWERCYDPPNLLSKGFRLRPRGGQSVRLSFSYQRSYWNFMSMHHTLSWSGELLQGQAYCDMHAVGLRNRRCLVTARQATEEVAVTW
jgi:hypothetical protein